MNSIIRNPIVVHLPHAKTRIPPRERELFLLHDSDMNRELHHMTDRYTDELFDFPCARVVFPVSRLVCDAERFREDAQEKMARIGMGAVYTRGASAGINRRVSAADRERILRTYYDPHHRRLNTMVQSALAQYGKCLILDGHSFSPVRLPYERSGERPDICIGCDSFHTPAVLCEAAVGLFTARGYRVLVNAPYAGSMVPLDVYGRDRRVSSMMIEVNRELYMDESGAKTAGFARVRRDLKQLYEAMLGFAAAYA